MNALRGFAHLIGKNPASDQTAHYTYDAASRLSAFSLSGSPQSNRSYTYDANGNFLTFAGRGFSYAARTNRLTHDGLRAFQFDPAGRVRQIGAAQLSYDLFSNMRAYGADAYMYNAEGQRVKKVENDQTTYYIKDGLNTIAEYDASGSLTGEYIYGAEGMIAKFSPQETDLMYFYTDHLGSVRQVEQNTQLRDYFPFGQALSSAGDETAYRFIDQICAFCLFM